MQKMDQVKNIDIIKVVLNFNTSTLKDFGIMVVLGHRAKFKLQTFFFVFGAILGH